ncbi:glutamyl-tRNA reductase [Alicyclobacillus cellulosilyticus]|uniref:Glutamyl-tRNA reductase n=1 Tax=Alicyclobacillus cellulosilyticus TaxID=1003997 RepID=A0A917NFN4_9BACL|nr:glutamyl-tRNA reductase [Alicyclobacillus cellulosilyticus]GGI96367.1 glutamyl-tRNA reductase [Alicyclobacillus cellulosilyticus]
MNLLVVGMNHKTAPVELRERVSVADFETDDVLARLRAQGELAESVVLSTCNRTEVYGVAADTAAAERWLREWFARRAGLPAGETGRHLYTHTGNAAVRHLFRVASGLDSLVVGETQILGQVRAAYMQAAEAGNTGWLCNQVFRLAIHVGKRAQTETGIGQNAVSVSYAAVQLVKKVFGDLRDRCVLVVGAGKMGQLTAQHLMANGIRDLRVVNRTFDHALRLAASVGGQAVAWSALEEALCAADIVIANTGARDVVLAAETVAAAMRRRHQKPMVIIDIAVPRDVDPEAARLRNVFLYDIDDLEGVVAANLAERARHAAAVERLIAEGMREFGAWLAEQAVVPLIAAVRARGAEVQAAVMDSLRRKLPHLSDRDWDVLDKHTMSIVNQLLHHPVHRLKALAHTEDGVQQLAWFAQLFNISEAEWAARLPDGAPEDARALTKWAAWLRQWSQSLLGEGEGEPFSACPVASR